MKKTILTLVGIFAIHAAANAQKLSTVGFGYGSFGFPPITNEMGTEIIAEATRGGAGYLNVMFERRDGTRVGGALILAGDSQIQYGGESYGSGAVGLAVTTDINWPSDNIRLGALIGGLGIHTYEKVDDIINATIQQQSGLRPMPQLKKTNIQPFGALRLSVYFVELQYAPVNNMLTVGFNLAFGR